MGLEIDGISVSTPSAPLKAFGMPPRPRGLTVQPMADRKPSTT